MRENKNRPKRKTFRCYLRILHIFQQAERNFFLYLESKHISNSDFNMHNFQYAPFGVLSPKIENAVVDSVH